MIEQINNNWTALWTLPHLLLSDVHHRTNVCTLELRNVDTFKQHKILGEFSSDAVPEVSMEIRLKSDQSGIHFTDWIFWVETAWLIFFLLTATAVWNRLGSKLGPSIKTYSCIHIHVVMQHTVCTSFGGTSNVLLAHRSQTTTPRVFRCCFQRARLSFLFFKSS